MSGSGSAAARPAVAEASGGRVLRRPNWRVAAGLSILPGLGQLYNGQPRKALFFLLGTVLTIGPGVLLLTAGQGFGHSLLEGHHFGPFLVVALGSVLIFLVLFVLGLFLWASSAADARRTAIALREAAPEDAQRTWFFRL